MFAAVAGLVCVAALPAESAEEKRPNIVFAFADDWGVLATQAETRLASGERELGGIDLRRCPNAIPSGASTC
jgi:hypothetical protein